MFAVPSKLTPCMVLAVSSAVAVCALPTTRSIVPSESSYVAVMPVSVLDPNIAPTVSWTTSVRSISAVPSKLTPCIVLDVARAVAVSAKATEILAVPSKLVPPIVLAVAKAVAVAALPVMSELVKANVPAEFGSVIVWFPLKSAWAGACSLA